MQYALIESEYLVELLKSAIKGTDVKAPPEDINWQKFVELAKEQQVYSIIAPILSKVNMPSEQAKELMLYNQNELLRMIAMKSEQEAIELELENKGIKFMLLKGSVIRNYYPQQKMRQMSDVDILYDGSKKEQLFDIMLSHGYSVMSCSENSDDFTKKPFYTFEFHRELFFSEHDFYFDFSYVWKNASQSKENTCKYEMSVDDLYLHSVAHMYKHYVLGGFGVRFLSDTYLTLTKNEGSMNFEYIASKLKEMNLTGFEEFVRKLSYELFGEGNFTSEQIEFLNSSFKFGIYGDTTQGVKLYYDEYLSRKGGKGTVLGYYASKIFPSARFMKRTYPKLNKCPYLLPLYYIYRLFDKLLFKSKATRENYKLLKQYNKEK